jgi:hypothetical protein
VALITLNVSVSYRLRLIMRGTEPWILIRLYIDGSRRPTTRMLLPATESNLDRLQNLLN